MRIESLTFLRFFAALVVVIYHYGQVATKGWPLFTRAGPQFVTFFFVLSGFVLTIAYGGGAKIKTKPYLGARFARVYPLYLLALVSCALVQLSLGETVRGKDFALNVFLVQTWFPPFTPTVNYPGWSISAEAVFYLMFPLASLGMERFRRWPYLVFLAAIFFWLVTQVTTTSLALSDLPKTYGPEFRDFILYNPLLHICSFVLGIAGAILFRERNWFRSSGFVATACALFFGWFCVAVLNDPAWLYKIIGYPVNYAGSFLSPLYLAIILSGGLLQMALDHGLGVAPAGGARGGQLLAVHPASPRCTSRTRPTWRPI